MTGILPQIPARVRGLTYALYSPLDPAFVGGIRSWIHSFWPAYLQATDSRAIVAHAGFRPRGGGAANAALAQRIESVLIPSFSLPGIPAPLPRVRELESLFAQRGVDVVYVDNGYAFQDVAALTAAMRANCATISGHHAVIRHGVAHAILWDLIGRRTVRRFDAVHVLNSADADYLRQIGCRNVRMVPIGVDERVFVPAARCGERVRYAFVGRLHPQKGIDRLAALVRALAARHGEGATFEIAGDGPQRSLIEPLTQLRQVHYHGQLGASAVADLLGRSDILLMPSRDETFGIAAAEAMMCGAAVLYSDIPALADVVGTAAGEPVRNTDDAEAWIAGADRLTQRVKARRPPAITPEMIRAHALSRFSFERTSVAFADLVEAALQEHEHR